MPNQDLNRRFIELLGPKSGLYWHEDVTNYDSISYHKCSCGKEYLFSDTGTDSFREHLSRNPDFILHPTLVLVEMMKREDFPEFCRSITGIAFRADSAILMDVKYFLDTTDGLLVKEAIKWMEKD